MDRARRPGAGDKMQKCGANAEAKWWTLAGLAPSLAAAKQEWEAQKIIGIFEMLQQRC
jgi:hypothetical protein